MDGGTDTTEAASRPWWWMAVGWAGAAVVLASLLVPWSETCDENGCSLDRLLEDNVGAIVLVYAPLAVCLAWLVGALRSGRAAAAVGTIWVAFAIAMTPVISAAQTDTTIEVRAGAVLALAGYAVLLVAAIAAGKRPR